jgi:cytochrome oxidase Cu insertion factor (SCO1/SenC/PrrC family)
MESKNTKAINRTTTMTTMTTATKTKASDKHTRTKKKKLHVRFISTAKVQDTFSKHDYDRASDPYAVWTHLTAQLAQQIKDELNAFKLEEMLVHHLSRGNTQFFL